MKKIYIIIVITLVVIISGFIIYPLINKDTNKKNNNNSFINNRDHNISGGAFTLIYDTQGGEKIDSSHVCIACGPSSYDDLPTPKKDGYIFDGWYYDTEYKDKVNGTKENDIKTNPKHDDHGCVIGYNPVTIYAKWK